MKDRKFKNKLLCLVLSALFVLYCFALSSCGVFTVNVPSSGEEETTAPSEETTAPPELDVVKNEYSNEVDLFLKDLSGTKYNGAVAKIVTVKKISLVPDETVSKVISEDLTERNEAVETALGVSLVCDERDGETLLSEVKAAVRSGDYYADIIMYPQDMIGSFVTEDAVLNMRSLPGFETQTGYYYSTAVEAGSGGDAVYAVAGPASLNADGLSCIYFNKTMLSATGLESVYDLVDRGEWTLDKYTQYVTAGGALEGEYYGYGAQNTATYLSDLFFFGAGERLTVSISGAYPYLTLGGEKTEAVIEKIKAATLGAESSGSALTAIEAFDAGKTLFLIDRLDTMKTLANSKTDWGIVPLPKYNAEQANYVTLANSADAIFISAISTSTNYSMTADVIACLNIMSYGYTQDAYVTAASYYYLRDNSSIRMLDTIVKNPVFDLSYSFAGSYNAIPSATFMAVRNAVSGVSTLERYLNMWSWQFENSMYYLFDVEE